MMLKWGTLLKWTCPTQPTCMMTSVISEDAWLSDYQIELKEQHNLPTSKVQKLLQTLFDKEKYAVNYKLLKLYVDLGLIVKKLYRVLQFRQEQ